MKFGVKNSATILSFAGNKKLSDAFQLEERLSELNTQKQYKIIVDLTNVEQMSSTTLGPLAHFAERCRTHHGELRLVITSERILHLLRVTMQDKIIEVYSSLEEAQEDF